MVHLSSSKGLTVAHCDHCQGMPNVVAGLGGELKHVVLAAPHILLHHTAQRGRCQHGDIDA